MAYENKDGASFWWATDRETGAEKRTKNGDRYMTGSITVNGVKMNATLFYSKQKQNPRQPDITILFSQQNGNQQRTQPAKRQEEDRKQEICVEDIPF